MKKLLLIPVLLLAFWGSPAHSEKLNVSGAVTLPSALTASATIMAAYYSDSDTFISKVYESKFPFQLLGLTWNRDLPAGTAADLTIRFQAKTALGAIGSTLRKIKTEQKIMPAFILI